MKKLLSLLSMLVCLGCFAQDFPVTVSNPFSAFGPETYQGGQKNNAYSMLKVAKANVLAATNTSIGHIYALNAGFGPQPGKAAKISSFVISSEKPITVQIRVGTPSGPLNGINIPEMDMVAVIPGMGQPVILPVNWTIRNGEAVLVYCLNFLDNSADSSWIGVYPVVTQISDDFNYNTRKIMKVVGTSISNGTGPDRTDSMYMVMAKEYFRSKGASMRIELEGISGSTSISHTSFVNRGAYDMAMNGQAPDLVVLETAVNDASAAVAVATSIKNDSLFCMRFLNMPEKKDIHVLVLGATPLQNTTAYNNAQTLDSAKNLLVTRIKALSANYADRISFVRLSNTYDRTVFANYISSDTNGAGIHPNNTGNKFIFTNGWLPWFSSADGVKFINWSKK